MKCPTGQNLEIMTFTRLGLAILKTQSFKIITTFDVLIFEEYSDITIPLFMIIPPPPPIHFRKSDMTTKISGGFITDFPSSSGSGGFIHRFSIVQGGMMHDL